MTKHLKNTTGAWPKKPSRVARSYPAYCTTCFEKLDLDFLVAKVRAGERYVHPCGRVLVRGDSILEPREDGGKQR